jgi:hypothetical protein
MKKSIFICIFVTLSFFGFSQNWCEQFLYQNPIVGGSHYQGRLFIPDLIRRSDMIYIDESKIFTFYAPAYNGQLLYYRWERKNKNGSSTIIKANCENHLDLSTLSLNDTIIVRSWLIQTVDTPKYIITSNTRQFVYLPSGNRLIFKQ